MKKLIMIFLILLIPAVCFGAITFDANGKWETTFDCVEQDQFDAGWLTCADGVTDSLEGSFFRKSLVITGENNWTQSTTNPSDWYYTGDALTRAGSLRNLTVNGILFDYSRGTSGSLGDTQYYYGDVDSIGSDTIYIKHTTDPDLEDTDYVYLFANVKSILPLEAGDYVSEILESARNPNGRGGKALRGYDGDGTTMDTANGKVLFPSAQKEIWIRYYQRHEAGYKWQNGYPIQDKNVYLFTGKSGSEAIVGYRAEKYSIQAQGDQSLAWPVETTESYGWDFIQGGNVGSGEYNCFEVYLKMDTGTGDNGVGRIWINGELRAENTAVDWSGVTDKATAQEGWTVFTFNDNQARTDNDGVAKYVDFDDIVVYNQTPPNTDADGNPYIGPIASGASTKTGVGTSGTKTSAGTGTKVTVGN